MSRNKTLALAAIADIICWTALIWLIFFKPDKFCPTSCFYICYIISIPRRENVQFNLRRFRNYDNNGFHVFIYYFSGPSIKRTKNVLETF